MERTLAVREKDRADRFQMPLSVYFELDKLSIGSILIQRIARLAEL